MLCQCGMDALHQTKVNSRMRVCSPIVDVVDFSYLKTLTEFNIKNRKTIFSHVPLTPEHHFLLYFFSLILKLRRLN